MLRSVQLIGANLRTERATVRLPDRVPPPENFRGEVLQEAANSIACGMCAYVCVSNAITGTEQQDAYAWAYEPSQCTFCARCVERCPVQALSNQPDTVRVYACRGELRVEHLVAFPHCPECGRAVRPAAERLARLALEDITDYTRQLLMLCERCRRKRIQQNIFAGGMELVEENR